MKVRTRGILILVGALIASTVLYLSLEVSSIESYRGGRYYWPSIFILVMLFAIGFLEVLSGRRFSDIEKIFNEAGLLAKALIFVSGISIAILIVFALV